jgi:hypothetical protein
MRNAEDDKIRFDASALAFSYPDGIDSGIVSAGGSRLKNVVDSSRTEFPGALPCNSLYRGILS